MAFLRKRMLAAAIVGIGLVIGGGFRPDGYLIHVRGVTDSPYPLRGVSFFGGLVVLECLVLFALLTYPRAIQPVWRSLVAFFLFGGWTFFLLLMSMHSAPYYGFHTLWAVGMTAYLFFNLVGSALRHPVVAR
jgi:hypothetical protein